MRKVLLMSLLFLLLTVPVHAAEFHAPAPPPAAEKVMPEHTENFGQGLREMVLNAAQRLRPDLFAAGRASFSILAAVMLISLLKTFDGPVKKAADLAGTASIAGGLLLTSHSMIRLGAETVTEISEYGKLLLPVMTGALAAQGGVTKSTALFAGTAGFMALLSGLISALLIPMTYLYLAFSTGSAALGQDPLKKLRDLIRSIITWSLKTIITVFTTYISLTGVITGTADAAALKAAKATVSTVVPVVGGILSGASETMLLSAAVLKNAAGLYGIFAVLAIFLDPFLRILLDYWMLKATGAICSIFGSGPVSDLLEDFSKAMGMLLAMTGTGCIMMLLGTVCFMKGVG